MNNDKNANSFSKALVANDQILSFPERLDEPVGKVQEADRRRSQIVRLLFLPVLDSVTISKGGFARTNPCDVNKRLNNLKTLVPQRP